MSVYLFLLSALCMDLCLNKMDILRFQITLYCQDTGVSLKLTEFYMNSMTV